MLHFEPSRTEFAELCLTSNTIPIYCSLLSDQLTPVSAFDRLAEGAEHAFLLESVVGGEKIARYSFLSTTPIALVESKNGRTVVTRDGKTETFDGADPLVHLESVLGAYRASHPTGLPRFLGGAVGYAGYDIVRHYEKLGEAPPDDRDLPDLQFGIYDRMVIFDHVRKLVHVVAHAHVESGIDPDGAYDDALSKIEEIVAKLGAQRNETPKPMGPIPSSASMTFDSSFTQERFEAAVERCKEYIRAGDIFQVVLSHRLSTTTDATPFDVYRALRVINPSPFMFYLQSPAVTLVGASPEILCRLEGDTISTRPLAGTRPRGRTEAEDLGLEAELLADPKERAEHVMLVDLGRNDLGRVCEPGSVSIDDLMSIERYSHVMHICSNVSGRLASGKTGFDALRSVLPVGTVSGAPKVRAMQIIDELETVRRGPYAGAVGYIDFAGNMDTCIVLRTLVITPTADGKWRADAQVGAGIVADSEPTREYQETHHKAQGMLSALLVANMWAAGKSKP
ncbi:MAG: anthranilate synthase component I [Planctomycetes bacterium]|nr:anthranilate synthase component I [Planctomycetota bacterium]